MKYLFLVLSFAASTWACGGNPTAPSAPIAPTRSLATLSGLVFAATSNGLLAVEGARVRVEGYPVDATTDRTGAYSVSGLHPGIQVVSTSKDGFVTDRRTVTVTGDTQIDIRIAQRLPYTLSGTVFEATPSGPAPIEGLEMYCDACGEFGHTRTYTDTNGGYTFTHVFQGPTVVLLSRGGYLNVRKEVTVSGDTRFDITLDPLR